MRVWTNSTGRFHNVDSDFVDLDSASGEPLHQAAREVLLAALDRAYADPRRLHRRGRDSRLLLDNAREVTASALGVRPDEVTFTPSGTHAVRLGLLGLVRPGARRAVIAHTAVEHSSVIHAARWGGDPTSVPVDREGRVVLSAMPAEADVIACQTANHEVGTVQPVAELAASSPAPLFLDACASMGRLPLPSGWASAAGSAHKWGGPAGVGVLLVRQRTRWRPPFPDDDRADPRTTGFENVPAALAAAAALQAVVSEREEVGSRQRDLTAVIRTRMAQVPDVDVVGHPDARLPHLVTFSALYVNGEALVRELDRRGFGVASGSACTASSLEPSHVLAAMGALTHGNVRVSLGRTTTRAQVAAFCTAVTEVIATLRREAGV